MSMAPCSFVATLKSLAHMTVGYSTEDVPTYVVLCKIEV